VSASSISRLGLFLDLGNGAGASAASGDLLGAGSAAGSAVPSMTFAASPARAANIAWIAAMASSICSSLICLIMLECSSDRLAPTRSATPPGARQRSLPDAEIVGAAGSWRLAPRQAHSEHRAFAWLAPHGHVAAHHARELAREGKAETGAAEAL